MRLNRARPLVLLLVIVGAFVIMLLDTIGVLAPVRAGLMTAMRPLLIAFSDARSAAGEVIQTARDLRTLRSRNQELETLVERLTIENLQLSETARENVELRSFFEFAQANPTYDFRGSQVIARVIGGGASAYANVISLDLGTRHGIQRGMPVVTDRGFVARVTASYPTTSEALLITDPNSSLNVMTQTSRAPGVLRGRAGQFPIMDLIPPNIEISIGEIVMTSGLAGNFPKGLVVGQLVEIVQNDNQAFQQAVIRPTVDFDRLELVLIITSFPPVIETEDPPTPTPTPES